MEKFDEEGSHEFDALHKRLHELARIQFVLIRAILYNKNGFP